MPYVDSLMTNIIIVDFQKRFYPLKAKSSPGVCQQCDICPHQFDHVVLCCGRLSAPLARLRVGRRLTAPACTAALYRGGGGTDWYRHTQGRGGFHMAKLNWWERCQLLATGPGSKYTRPFTWRHIQAQTPQLKVHYRRRTPGEVSKWNVRQIGSIGSKFELVGIGSYVWGKIYSRLQRITFCSCCN